MNASQTTNDSAAAYARLARYYDLQHATYTPDVSMYQQFAAQCHAGHPGGAPILEIGCGTGRVMIPLVEAGYRVVGVDESPEMLSIARSRLAEKPAGRWQLIEADMRALELPERFAMAFIALNTFLHNLTRDNQLAMLLAARRHLLVDGLLIVDLPPNDELAYQPDDGEFEFEATLMDPATNIVTDKFVASRVFWADQSQELSYRLDEKTPGGVHSQTVTFRLRHVFRHEMELLLLHAGFTHCQWFGDYDQSPYCEGSPRMIAVARL
jgi:ubiquinone/menaquinone biosynthesis C-methylase UbiE